MKTMFTCKKIPLNDSIKVYTQKHLDKLDRYFKEEPTAKVTFCVEKNHLCTAEITIRGGTTLFRALAEEPDGDMRSAVDTAVRHIERRILKNKTRLSKRLRSDAFPILDDKSLDVEEEKEFDIVRTKHFSVKPMSVEEAIMQMNLLDHSFFVFRNIDNPSLSIVYRRHKGGYGIIETDEP